MPERHHYYVGNALIEPLLNQISLDGRPTRVEPRIMKVLQCLREHHEQVVTREQLLDHAWPPGYASDEGLTKALSQLRKALGDTARQARMIETIPKVGYRLVAPVTPGTVPQEASHIQGLVMPTPPSNIKWLWAAVVALFLMVVGQWQYFQQAQPPALEQASPMKRIVKLPMGVESMTPENMQQLLATALGSPDSLFQADSSASPKRVVKIKVRCQPTGDVVLQPESQADSLTTAPLDCKEIPLEEVSQNLAVHLNQTGASF